MCDKVSRRQEGGGIEVQSDVGEGGERQKWHLSESVKLTTGVEGEEDIPDDMTAKRSWKAAESVCLRLRRDYSLALVASEATLSPRR